MSKILKIDWIDSMYDHGWKSKADCETAHVAICQSVGFLVNETEEIVLIAMNRGKDKNSAPWGDLIAIPKVSIKKMKKL